MRLGSGTDVDDNTQISHWFYVNILDLATVQT